MICCMLLPVNILVSISNIINIDDGGMVETRAGARVQHHDGEEQGE